MKRNILMVFAVVAVLLGVTSAPALAYEYPSTNDANRAAGDPHVNLVGNDLGEVTLEFVNDHDYVAFFEYRIDGETPTSCSVPHPVVEADCIYPGVSVTSANSPVIRTFQAEQTVEVRLALGAERDHDFDWVAFDVLPDAGAKADCKEGGWAEFGFRNQGQCIRFVNTGKDSR
jgi:hypothetical protein